LCHLLRTAATQRRGPAGDATRLRRDLPLQLGDLRVELESLRMVLADDAADVAELRFGLGQLCLQALDGPAAEGIWRRLTTRIAQPRFRFDPLGLRRSQLSDHHVEARVLLVEALVRDDDALGLLELREAR